MERGADITTLNHQGKSPLSVAEQHQLFGTVKVLQRAMKNVTGDEVEGEWGMEPSSWTMHSSYPTPVLATLKGAGKKPSTISSLLIYMHVPNIH